MGTKVFIWNFSFEFGDRTNCYLLIIEHFFKKNKKEKGREGNRCASTAPFSENVLLECQKKKKKRGKEHVN